MNTKQIIESVRQVFPTLSKNQIRLDLDSAQKLLATETGCLTVKGSLSNIATNFAWILPSKFISMTDLVFYDSLGNPKYPSDYNYKYEIELGKLFIYSSQSVPITGLNTEISSVYLHYKELPDTLATESTSMEVNEQFRDAIESYVLGKYFSKFPIDAIANGQVVKILNLQAAQLHKNEYEKLRIKLKKYLGSQIKTSGEAQFYQHAGAQILPKRPNDSGGDAILSITGISESYTKYAYFKATGAGSVIPTLQVGYTTIACNVVGDTITLTSSAEFDEETIIVINNWDCSWTRDSSSQYTITAPTGWTTIAFEIYERS